ncbi:MAG: TatD family hydrolase [Opitutaceae bacterium]|nr:TatD family hydrolase [Opitutaceae bacterium]
MLFDAHNHLHFAALAPHLGRVFVDLRAIDLRGAVVNGTCEEEWPAVSALAREQAWIVPSYGVHPWDAGNRSHGWQATLRSRLVAESASHVGEIGLDRRIIDDLSPDDPRIAGLRVAPLAEQAEVFSWQLALAAELNRAASIHCLRAIGPLHEILRASPRPARGFLLHAYNGPRELVEPLAALGAYFSYNGRYLHARHEAKNRAFLAVPLDRLLVETDAPAMELTAAHERFKLPASAEGQRVNHPANLVAAYAGLAALRRLPLEELITQVARNFARLFGEARG